MSRQRTSNPPRISNLKAHFRARVLRLERERKERERKRLKRSRDFKALQKGGN